MIKTNRPAIAGTKYVLATDAGVAVGTAVARRCVLYDHGGLCG